MLVQMDAVEAKEQSVSSVNWSEVEKLKWGNAFDPHQTLGLHENQDGSRSIRIWRPGAQSFYIHLLGDIIKGEKIDSAGLFEFTAPGTTTYADYKVYHQSGLLHHDPYSFVPVIGQIDQYLFANGTHYEIYNKLGAHQITHQGVEGTLFAVWAPNARSVALVADFNYFNGAVNPMRGLGHSGIWELFVPGVGVGERYKFEIRTQSGELLVKSDPYANQMEFRPSTASIVTDLSKYSWNDDEWMAHRKSLAGKSRPENIYEVHLGSWKKDDGWKFQNYRTLAHELVDYCIEMGFTHVELLPISEHPLDESWGYQVTGYYAVTSRHGAPADFQYFVDHLHQNGIGVIIDWVPGHFPSDDFALAKFDGTSLYEHADPRQGWHPHWSTYIFNYGRNEVSNFLIANALFWFERFHIDGLRVDAVASMLYLDYGREEGEWIPNQYGGKENLAAIEFLKHLNAKVHERFPGVQMIAEESTSFAAVTTPVAYDGLGFDLKWNMGWMNDTLRYMSRDSIYRRYHQNDLTFGLLYAFSERFCMVFSHDEVVHGKGSLLSKMPGDMWQKFANMRLLYSYMGCQPGKKLIFMGGEIGIWNEWNCTKEMEWFLLDFPLHSGLQRMVKEMNHLIIQQPALYERDFTYTGFEWVDLSDQDNSVIAYRRKSGCDDLLCVHNFTPNYHGNYFLKQGGVRTMSELFNSDDERYGGSGKRNHQPSIVRDSHGNAVGINLQLAPLATMVFKLEF